MDDRINRYNPGIHHRRSIGLRDYDYTQAGAYFVTICTEWRECLFGEIENGMMCLSDAGRIIQSIWEGLPQRFPNIALAAFVVMPNHFHATLITTNALERHPEGAHEGAQNLMPTPSFGSIIGAFKSLTTREYIHGVSSHGWPPFPGKLWQRNFYEHVIRDEIEFDALSTYIANNPARWGKDVNNPTNV